MTTTTTTTTGAAGATYILHNVCGVLKWLSHTRVNSYRLLSTVID